MPVTLGVLIRPTQSSGGHPNDWPLGRAALALEAEGAAVIFGGQAERGVLIGQRATPAGWVNAQGDFRIRFVASTNRPMEYVDNSMGHLKYNGLKNHG